MIKCRHRKSNFIAQWSLILILTFVFLMPSSEQALSQSEVVSHKNRTAQGLQKHSDNRLMPFGIALDYQPGQRTNHKSMSYEDKDALIKKYQKWKSLPPEKKDILRQRMQQWNQLPPEKRQLYQQRFNQWEKLSPIERQSIRKKLEKWNHLSPTEKEKIRERFRNE